MATQAEIDAILDAALDELDIDDESDSEDEINTNNNPQEVTNAVNRNTTPDTITKPPETAIKDDVGEEKGNENNETIIKEQNNSKKQKGKKSEIKQGCPPKPADNQFTEFNFNEAEMLDNMMRELLFIGENNKDAGGSAEEAGAEDDECLGKLLEGIQSQLVENHEIGGGTTNNQKSSSRSRDNADTTIASKKGEKKLSSTDSKVSNSNLSGNNGNAHQSRNQNEDSEVNQTISNLLNGMAKHHQEKSPPDGFKFDANSNDTTEEENLIKKMMEQFENLDNSSGGDESDLPSSFNSDSFIDGMMEQLLSKELMYEPMKQVTEKFPQWLKSHKDKISEEQYKQRCKQHEYFQKLIDVYETNPENVQTLMILMQEVQEFGQPPIEIIQEIAPGLQLDGDGLPNLSDGALPPFFNGNSNEECSLM